MEKYLIREVIENEQGKTEGVLTVGNFSEEKDRDHAFDKYFIEKNRKAFRHQEEVL